MALEVEESPVRELGTGLKSTDDKEGTHGPLEDPATTEEDRHHPHVTPRPLLVQTRSSDVVHHVQTTDKLLDPARPAVVPKDWTFGSETPDTCQRVNTMSMIT